MGYVYLILEVDKHGDEHHKIGITKNHPTKRQSELQTGNSNKISVLNFYESVNYKKVEQMLHNKFANFKTDSNNEWFTLSDNDVLSFKYTCKKVDVIINSLKENPFYK